MAESVRKYVNHLFGEKGLVVIDSDNNIVKSLFNEVIKADLFDHTPEKIVNKTSQKLEKLGYKAQSLPEKSIYSI